MRSVFLRYQSVVLLAALLVLFASGCSLGNGSKSSTTTLATPTPIVIDGVAFMTVSDAMFGFRLDIPQRLQKLQAVPEPSTGGDFNLWQGQYPDPLGSIDIRFGGDTSGLYPNQCPQGIPDATPVIVGAGITGYQVNNLNISGTPPPGGSYGPPEISVTFLVKGVVIGFSLGGIPPYYTFMQRYGPIWRHMLASFTPGKYVNPHPICGS